MHIIKISLALLLFSCTKEETTPVEAPKTELCDCYTYHEKRGVDENYQIIWEYDMESTLFKDLCEKDDGTWIETDNHNKRYKYICE